MKIECYTRPNRSPNRAYASRSKQCFLVCRVYCVDTYDAYRADLIFSEQQLPRTCTYIMKNTFISGK